MSANKQHKRDVRAVQQATGRHYTQAARTLSQPTDKARRPFLLRELLTECATLPPASVDWGDDEELAPAVFDSRLLGAAVPYGTVLELAGTLAQAGTQARILVESLHPLEEAVVACGERRFQLVLSQDLAYELCRRPGCRSAPLDLDIAWCADHVAGCDADALVVMAGDWGSAQSQDLDQRHPANFAGGLEGKGDLLVKAAVAQGVFERVSTALLQAYFGDPEMLEETYYDEVQAAHMRHALELERIRLRRLAQTEARRLRQEAGTCAACGKSLPTFFPHLSFPPHYCSRDCAPAERTATRAAADWGTP